MKKGLGMTHDRILMTGSVVALTLALAACGGESGSGVASMPPAPVTPTPTPAQSGIAVRATVGAGPAPVFATAGGPNFTTGPTASTVFPMLQVAMTQNGIRYAPDSSTNAAGGRATFSGGQVSVSIPDSRPNPWSGYADLDWTRAGQWSVSTDWNTITNGRGAFIIGFETPGQAMPATGSATFSGKAEGTVFNSSSDRWAIDLTGGTTLFTANFAARTLNGTVTGLAARDAVNGISTGVLVPWNDFSFTSTITANAFSGSTVVTSAPGGITSLGGSAAGTIEGKFFGPTAQEAGAVWTLFDGSNGQTAVGTLTGKQH
jgi:hypothetical protein